MTRLSVVLIVKEQSLELVACLGQFSRLDEFFVPDGGNADDGLKMSDDLMKLRRISLVS